MARSAAAAATWIDYALVNSSREPGTSWRVQVNDRGQWRCNCQSFIFSREKPRTCKHVRGCQTDRVGQSAAAIATLPETPVRPDTLRRATLLVEEMLRAAMVTVQPHKREMMALVAAQYLGGTAPADPVVVESWLRRITLEGDD